MSVKPKTKIPTEVLGISIRWSPVNKAYFIIENRDCAANAVVLRVINERPEAIAVFNEIVSNRRGRTEDSAECPHGNKLGECNACDVAGDQAFDAAREDRR